jgi:hypothetical protein
LFLSVRKPSTTPTPTDPSLERTDRHLRTLQELAEIGMEMARLLRDEASCFAHRASQGRASQDRTPGDPERRSAPDLALQFARIARAVRQTVALEARLVEERAAFDERVAQAARRQADHLTAERKKQGAARKLKATVLVEQIIQADVDRDGESERAEALFDDLCAFVVDSRTDADYADRPVGEILLQICKDLGIAPDWSLWPEAAELIARGRGEPPIDPSPTCGPRRPTSPRSRGEETVGAAWRMRSEDDPRSPGAILRAMDREAEDEASFDDPPAASRDPPPSSDR